MPGTSTLPEKNLEICAAVMTDAETFELIFTSLDSPIDDERVRQAGLRGLRCCGAFLYKNGTTIARLNADNPPAFDVFASAIWSFAETVDAHIKQQSQSWLEKLYALPDTRNREN